MTIPGGKNADGPAAPRPTLPTVGDLCSTNFVTASRRRRAVELARTVASKDSPGVVVTQAGRPVGVITKHTIIKRALARGYTGMEITAGDIVSSAVVTVDARQTVRQAAALMARTGERHLVVIKDGRLYGLLSDRQVAGALRHLLGQAAD